MTYIHLITGEKGGTGKSWFARFLAQYCRDRNIPVALFDADTHNPDAFTELSSKIVEFGVYGSGLAWSQIGNAVESTPCIVNLPPRELEWAGIDHRWIGTLQSAGISICLWWVTDGSPTNVRQLRRALERTHSSVQWVVVRNLALISQWDDLDADSEAHSSLSEAGLHRVEMDFSKIFSDALVLEVERQNISMSDAVSSLDVLAKANLSRFFRQIDEISLLPNFFEPNTDSTDHADSVPATSKASSTKRKGKQREQAGDVAAFG